MNNRCEQFQIRPTPPRKPGRRGSARRGLTLVELMLAVSIMTLVGGCIVVMIKGTADGTAGNADGRRHLVRTQAMEATVAAIVRPCWAVLAAGNGYVVLWTGDGADPYIAANQAVNLSEMVMLELDANAKQLKCYKTVWPAGYSQANTLSNDTLYAASSNWYSAAQAAKSGSFFVPTVLANNVTAFNVTLDNATAVNADMATLWITFDDGKSARTIAIPAALRATMVPQ